MLLIDRDRDLPPRDRPLPHRYPPRNQAQHNAPSMMPPIAAGGHPPIMPMGHPPPDRKDYYDSYNRYFRPNSSLIHVHAKQTVYIEIRYVAVLVK